MKIIRKQLKDLAVLAKVALLFSLFLISNLGIPFFIMHKVRHNFTRVLVTMKFTFQKKERRLVYLHHFYKLFVINDLCISQEKLRTFLRKKGNIVAILQSQYKNMA